MNLKELMIRIVPWMPGRDYCLLGIIQREVQRLINYYSFSFQNKSQFIYRLFNLCNMADFYSSMRVVVSVLT